MSNVIQLDAARPERTFTDTDRLEHLYAAIAFMVHNGNINPLALSLRLPQLDGTEVDITLNEVMNQARLVIDSHYLLPPNLDSLRRYDLDELMSEEWMSQSMAAVDDGKYVLLEDVRKLLGEA